MDQKAIKYFAGKKNMINWLKWIMATNSMKVNDRVSIIAQVNAQWTIYTRLATVLIN